MLFFRYFGPVFCILLLLSSAFAGSDVFIKNLSGHNLDVKVHVFGDPLDTRAWKQRVTEVGRSARTKVLSFNRDRYIKSGKTYIFGIELSFEGRPVALLTQAVRGKFINSRMWHGATKIGDKRVQWHRGRNWSRRAVFENEKLWTIWFRARKSGFNDDIEYVVSAKPVANVEGEASLKVGAYNVFFRPATLFKDGQKKRAKLIPHALPDADVLVLSEVFDDKVRGILLEGLKERWPHKTQVLGSDRGLEQDGGVVILSRWPILMEAQVRFGSLCSRPFEDCFADKGALYARILKGQKTYHIVGTHLQAGGKPKDRRVRKKQLRVVKGLADTWRRAGEGPLFYAGDFNVDRLANDGDYQEMLRILKVDELERRDDIVSSDSRTNELTSEGAPEDLDHVLLSSDSHPVEGESWVVPLKSKTGWRKSHKKPLLWDLSDHYPAFGSARFSIK